MNAVRVIVVSDSHLSARTPEAQAHWDAVVDLVAAAAPDLVVRGRLADLLGVGRRPARGLGRRHPVAVR